MHGLVNKAFQAFLRDAFGAAVWTAVSKDARLGFDSFETLSDHDPALTERIIAAATGLLGRSREVLFEDMGTYLVSHPNTGPIRRLLRFGGVRFIDFLHSLDDLPERGRLALPDLHLPAIELTEHTTDTFTLNFNAPLTGSGHLLIGLLRAMADDYGALVMLEHKGTGRRGEMIGIQLLDQGFAEGRSFDLATLGAD